MAKLTYSVICSLDGFVADETGNFDWAAPDEEVHAFVNELEREIGTYLYGRRMYDVMAAWESMEIGGEPAVMQDFAQIWRAADKVVYSRTLPQATTTRTRVERTFDADAIRRMKAASERDMSVGGPGLAAAAIKAGLVDEYHLFLTPVLVGAGTAVFPAAVRLDLELLDEHRFRGGAMHLHYRTSA
jgi:dihydrofolate reductase